MVTYHPENHGYRQDLVAADIDLGDAYAAMGHLAEASSSFDAALAIHRKMVEADPSTPSFRSEMAATFRRRGIAMQKCGRPADAASDFRQAITLYQGLTKPTPGDYYNIACYQSLLSGVAAEAGSGPSAADGQATASEAITTLHRAVAAGWRDAAWMRSDPDLDPIRSRPDFQALFLDVAFPIDPFAQPR